MTSAIRETSTNIFRIVIEFVDNTLHQGLSLLDSIVGFPVSTDESLVSGEEVSQKESIEHIFFLKLIYNEVWEFEDLKRKVPQNENVFFKIIYSKTTLFIVIL